MKFFKKILIFILFLAIIIWPLFNVKAGPPRNLTFTFTKDNDNPTVPVGAPGAWDERAVLDPNVFKEADNNYKMYYLGWNNSYVAGIGLASSTDGIHWTKYEGNPVMVGGPDGSYDHDLWEGEVKKEDGIYKMWYQASGDGGTVFKSNYATSPDGITWTKYAGNPIIQGGVGKWDQDYVGIRSVIKIGNTYYAWYEGSKYHYDTLEYDPFGVGYATSTDGIHWTKISVNAPVLKGDLGQWDEEGVIPSVARVGNLFVMFLSTHITTSSVGMATSIDGVNWTKYPNNPVFDLLGSAGNWDDELGGAVISNIIESFQPAIFRLYYRGEKASILQSGGITLETSLPGYPQFLEQYKSDGTTAIPVGGLTNNGTTVFKFTMYSSILNDVLTPQIELREFNVPFTGEPTHSGTARVLADVDSVIGEVTVTGLESGKSYHWQAIANNAGGNGSRSFGEENENTGADFTVDTIVPEPPTITSVTPDNIISYSERSAVHVIGTAEAGSTINLMFSDNAWPISHIATASGSADNSGNYDLMVNAALLNNGVVEVSATATDAANNVSDATSLSVVKNTLIPEVDTGIISAVNNSATLNGTVTNSYDAEVTERGFQYGPTTDYGSLVSLGSGLGQFSKLVNNLTCDKTYHVRAYALNGSGAGYGLDNTFYSGACSSNGWFNFSIPKLLGTNWWSFSEDKTDPRKIIFNFKVEDVAQLAISSTSDYIGVSWQKFESALPYSIIDRSKAQTVFIKFRSPSGGQTKVYPMLIPATKIKISPVQPINLTKFVFKRNLNLGSRGDDVKQLQTILKKLNFMPTKIASTGYYGLLTKQALAKLQKYYDKLPYNKTYNLKIYSGIFNTETRHLVNKVVLAN